VNRFELQKKVASKNTEQIEFARALQQFDERGDVSENSSQEIVNTIFQSKTATKCSKQDTGTTRHTQDIHSHGRGCRDQLDHRYNDLAKGNINAMNRMNEIQIITFVEVAILRPSREEQQKPTRLFSRLRSR